MKIFLAVFVIWQLAVILYQFWEPFRIRLARLQFYLCGLLPTWQMFGAEPADGDYLVYYRTSIEPSAASTEPSAATAAPAPADSHFTDWQLVDYDQKPVLPLALFFNPHGFIIKGLREICLQASRATSPRNIYYQLLLNDLIRRSRQRDPNAQPAAGIHQRETHPVDRIIQFQIHWQTPATITPIFSSHAHPY
jgi:hypothetical protein